MLCRQVPLSWPCSCSTVLLSQIASACILGQNPHPLRMVPRRLSLKVDVTASQGISEHLCTGSKTCATWCMQGDPSRVSRQNPILSFPRPCDMHSVSSPLTTVVNGTHAPLVVTSRRIVCSPLFCRIVPSSSACSILDKTYVHAQELVSCQLRRKAYRLNHAICFTASQGNPDNSFAE